MIETRLGLLEDPRTDKSRQDVGRDITEPREESVSRLDLKWALWVR